MSPLALLPFVEKFPDVSTEERALLLDFARTASLHYGAWKPFKKLFKLAETALNNGNPDVEMLGVLLHRVDEMSFAQSSTRWKAVDGTLSGNKNKSASGGGFKYTVGPRNSWYDYTGWRLVVEPIAESGSGVFAGLRRALNLVKADSQTIAFDFDAREYIYEVKSVKLEGGALKIVCGASHSWGQNREYTFIVDVSDPQFIHLQTAGPSTPTIQYMKRRARRVLRHLSKQNPDLYLQVVMQLLHEHEDRVLDPVTNWAAMDVLAARSPRWKQTQPGRGAYKNVGGFVRTRREERAPEVWDKHLAQVEALLADASVPPRANEMALKILRANKAEQPVLEIAQLKRFLTSKPTLLQSLATRQLAQAAQNGEALDGATWAQLVLKSNARTRRLLLEKTGEDTDFTSQATAVLSTTLDGDSATKKRRAASVLVARFADSISDDTVWKHLQTFADVNEYSKRWVFEKIAASAARGEFARLAELSRLRKDLRDQALQSFSEAAKNAAPTIEQSLPLVATADQANNALGWQFLAATAITPQVSRELWRRVLGSTSFFASQVHATAAQNDGALQLFERADFPVDEIEKWLPHFPAFQAALSPAFFAAILRRISTARQINLVLAGNDEQWSGARSVLLQTLESPSQLGAFWNRVLDLVSGDENVALLNRIVDDEEISATFTRVPQDKIAELLERTNPVLESWLARWLDVNIASLRRDDSALLFAAMSPLTEIRRRGLARVQELGLDLPLALRLMESGLPQPFEVGRSWFETDVKLDLADRALALCDSPDEQVRAFGRTFLETHREQVLDAKLLKKLSENSDAQMQVWLAEHLLRDAPDVEVTAFDAGVLRARGRARRAKEAVKARRDLTKNDWTQNTSRTNIEYSNEEVATLLDVARGRTKRDREWALQQLAQAALNGREIEGVTIS